MDAPHQLRDAARRLRRRMSLPEVLLWKELRGGAVGGLRFRRQHPIGAYVLDFYCDAARLAVEVDGDHHAFGDRPQADAARDAWLAARGVRVLRLSARDVLRDPAGAARMVLEQARG